MIGVTASDRGHRLRITHTQRQGGNRSYEVQTGMYSTPHPVIMTLQIPSYTVCLNLFENHLAHAFYHTFDFNLFIGH